jgi:hypothetical protein
MAKLKDIALVLKSKNAGLFELTIDAVFADRDIFERVAKTGVLCPALFAELYDVPEDSVLFTQYAPGLAFKATIPRLVSAGDIGDTDVYGAQQHAPLLDVEIPV